MDAKINALIVTLEAARSRLNAVMDLIAPQAEIYPNWKVKQLLDHITGWDELVIATLRTFQRGETPERSVRSINQYNVDSLATRKSLSLEQSRKAYDTARQEVLQTLRELTPDMLTQQYKAPWGGKCSVDGIVKIFVSHELEHAKEIEKWLTETRMSS